MKPNKEEFIDKIALQLDDEQAIEENNNLSEAIYTVLFDSPLSQLTESQLGFLSLLLHSEIPHESQDVLMAISETFPATGDYIKNLYKHRDLLIKGGKNAEQQLKLFGKNGDEIYGERIYFITGIQKSLFDIFAIPDDYGVLKAEIWKSFCKDIAKDPTIDPTYIATHFSILSYNPFSGTLELHADSEQAYQTFEQCYVRSFINYIKRISYKLKTPINYTYTIGNYPNTPSPIPVVPKKKEHYTINNHAQIDLVIDTIKVKENPDYTRDNCLGTQKSTIKDMLDTGKNIFIGGNDNLGKSHLIQAVIKKCKDEGSDKHIVYTTGDRLYGEMQRRFTEDRLNSNQETKYLNKEKKYYIGPLLDALSAVDILVIDDFDALSGTKNASQDIINQVYAGARTQIILLSKLPPSRIQRHSKFIIPGSKPDYAPASLIEKFSPVLVHMEPFDISTKKQIATDIWKKKSQPNLFMTQEIVSGVIEFLAEHVSPKIYPQLIQSIMLNTQGDETSVSQKIYEVIETYTGKTIIPTYNEIVDVIIEEFNLDDINAYITKSALSGSIYGNIDRAGIYNDKWVRADSIEGTVLRLCIYFIKEYYPDQSLEAIGKIFNRTNASNLYNEANLYKEANEWLKSASALKKFLDDKIRLSLKKKYGLAHTI